MVINSRKKSVGTARGKKKKKKKRLISTVISVDKMASSAVTSSSLAVVLLHTASHLLSSPSAFLQHKHKVRFTQTYSV